MYIPGKDIQRVKDIQRKVVVKRNSLPLTVSDSPDSLSPVPSQSGPPASLSPGARPYSDIFSSHELSRSYLSNHDHDHLT